jgi:hypothetical protein
MCRFLPSIDPWMDFSCYQCSSKPTLSASGFVFVSAMVVMANHSLRSATTPWGECAGALSGSSNECHGNSMIWLCETGCTNLQLRTELDLTNYQYLWNSFIPNLRYVSQCCVEWWPSLDILDYLPVSWASHSSGWEGTPKQSTWPLIWDASGEVWDVFNLRW